MTICIEQPRFGCMLGGQQSVIAIERAIPIVHGGPGCALKVFDGQSYRNGFQGSSYAGGSAIVGTNTGESEVIFGGEQRLREVIEGALQVMDGDLFVVLTGCTAELVGDDVGQVVADFRRRGVPIVYASTGGFKGTSYQGHEAVVRAILEQLIEPTGRRQDNLVNVWSVVPYQDTFWEGNNQVLRELLAGIGLEANLLFGHGSGGLADWRRVPEAALNLVVSPWTGLEVAKSLEERFGTPYLHWPIAPIGATGTSRFLRTLAERVGVPPETVERFVEPEEDRFYYYLDRAADFFLEMRWDIPDSFLVIADSLYVLAISQFLVDELSLTPEHQYVVDDPPESAQELVRSLLSSLRENVSSDVTFSKDGGEIAASVRGRRFIQPPLLLGSSWDRDLAREIGASHLAITLPVTDRLVLDRGYFGYAGGLRLIEDIYAAALATQQ